MNTVADALSRQHNDEEDADHKSWARDKCIGYTFDEPENDEEKHEQVNAIVVNPTNYDWGKLQEDDETIHMVKCYLLSGKNPANNGEPFRFRIGSVKSAQLFQLSAENFFRLRYESVPLQ